MISKPLFAKQTNLGSTSRAPLGQDIDHKRHDNLTILIDGLVTTTDDAPLVAQDFVRFLDDFVSVRQLVSRPNRM